MRPAPRPPASCVRLYVRARFGREDVGDAGRARMRAALDEARRALHDTRRDRRGGKPDGIGPGGSAKKREERVLAGR